MGKSPQTDDRITTHEFDVETDQKVTQKLADMGINKIEDLGPGRGLDAGSAANHLMGIDPQVSPLLAEKIVRDAQFAEMAGHPGNPATDETEAPVPGTPPAPSREEQLNADLAAAKAEADDWKQKYGERENKLGDERRRTAERLARLEGGTAVTPQPTQTGFTPSMQYDPRLLGGRDPDAPMTNAEGASLLQSLAQAWGAELTTREAQLLETTRQLRDYNVTPDQEVSLIERHRWLANLPRGEQMAAMRDLAPAVTPTNTQPSGTPPVPNKQDMVELARARLRTATTYIEPSTQGSPVESSAAGEDNSTLAKKAMRLRELMNVKGASTDPKLGPEMERLMNETQGRR